MTDVGKLIERLECGAKALSAETWEYSGWPNSDPMVTNRLNEFSDPLPLIHIEQGQEDSQALEFACAVVRAFGEKKLVPADALEAAQKRIAELEEHMNDALFTIAVTLSFCPDDLDEAQNAVVRTGLVADGLREALFPDGDEQPPFADVVAHYQKAALDNTGKGG